MSLPCYVHPASSAHDRCAVCRRAVCPACAVTERAAVHCRSCAAELARRRRVRRAWLLAAALVALLLILGLVRAVVGCAAGLAIVPPEESRPPCPPPARLETPRPTTPPTSPT